MLRSSAPYQKLMLQSNMVIRQGFSTTAEIVFIKCHIPRVVSGDYHNKAIIGMITHGNHGHTAVSAPCRACFVAVLWICHCKASRLKHDVARQGAV